jgi:uncharacterized protein involved in type VI secretion and phage assembly
MNRFYGKYRGKVESNVDPDRIGRIQVSVPAVLGSGTLSWAMPCAPYAGRGVGFFAIPPIGANVWVEFESGDPDYPIWSGCFWGTGEAPAKPGVPTTKVLKTTIATIEVNEAVGELAIELKTGAKISMGPKGVEISNGQGATLKMSGPQVSVNNGALEVT